MNILEYTLTFASNVVIKCFRSLLIFEMSDFDFGTIWRCSFMPMPVRDSSIILEISGDIASVFFSTNCSYFFIIHLKFQEKSYIN